MPAPLRRHVAPCWVCVALALTAEADEPGLVPPGIGPGVMEAGAEHYRAVCLGCHQADGGGVPGAFPPLFGSPWVDGDPERVIKIVLHGLTGPMEVGGRDYNLEMPPQGPLLDDEAIAQVLTYVRNSWGNRGEPVSAAAVAAVRSRFPDRLAFWETEELLEAHPITDPEATGAGAGGPLHGVRFAGYKGSWSELPDVGPLTPVASGVVAGGLPGLDVWKGRRDGFALRFTGEIAVPDDGEYSFELSSDDGSRLRVGGAVVVDNDGVHGTETVFGSVRLRAGRHPFVLDYFEQAGEETLSLSWSGPEFAAVALTKAPRRKGGSFGMLLRPSGMNARVYRGFIEGAGPRAIAVGYPGAVNLAWDPANLRLALLWRGPFIDAARHWEGRGAGFQPPANPHAIAMADGVPLAWLEQPRQSAWPRADERRSERFRTSPFVFGGYRLDANSCPTFRYRLGEVEVTDRFEPVVTTGSPLAATAADAFARTLTIAPAARFGRAALYHRVARAVGAIERTGDETYVVDQGLEVAFEPGDAVRALLRESGGSDELLVEVHGAGGPVEVRYRLRFL